MLKTNAFIILFINFLLFNLIVSKDVKFIELPGLTFFRNRTIDGVSELVCDENEGEDLCENFHINAAECENKNYKKEKTVDWFCTYENLNDEVVIKDYLIQCEQIDEYSFKEGTCFLEYKLKVNKDKEPQEQPNKNTDPLVYVIYIIGSISALVLLTLILFFSYKLIDKYRTRKFSF